VQPSNIERSRSWGSISAAIINRRTGEVNRSQKNIMMGYILANDPDRAIPGAICQRQAKRIAPASFYRA
jgi:hypothetical protein